MLDKKNIKKLDILLVMCPMWAVNIPPLGITYLGSYLESKGFNIKLLDINVDLYHKASEQEKSMWEMEKYLLWTDEDLFPKIKQKFASKIDYYVNYILSMEPKTVGFSLMASNDLFSIELARGLKQKNPKLIIIFGGPSCFWQRPNYSLPAMMYSSKCDEPYFKPGFVDIFVIGEAEETLVEVLHMVRKGKRYPVKGTKVYFNGEYFSLTPRKVIVNLDTLPFPALEKLSLSSYTDSEIPILMSRGCIRRCNFCNDWKLQGPYYRVRSAEDVFREIKYRVERFKIKNFIFNDLLINGNLKRLEGLCQLLIDSNLRIHWSAQGGIRKDMKFSLLKKMRQSGCDSIVYGVESFSNVVLKKMNKPYTVKEISKVLQDTKKAKIRTCINLIVGCPGEREEEFRQNMENLKNNYMFIDEISSLNPCYVNLGTALLENQEDFSLVVEYGTGCMQWYTQEGDNNYSIRMRRIEELANFVKDLNIPVKYLGTYGQDTIKENKREVLTNSLEVTSVKGKETFFNKPSGKDNIARSNKPLWRLSILVFLMLITIVFSLYIWSLKRIKKIIIFPGG